MPVITAPIPGVLQPDAPRPLIDGFARRISYLRLSVTDRCDLRCTYCMAEKMTFLPTGELLTIEELDRVATAFVERGVRKVRLSGGEPLVRRGILDLIGSLSRHLGRGLDELTLTTNGTQLARFADDLAAAGVRRVNVSLDTLDTERFAAITRRGRLEQVLEGIAAAHRAGLRVKINTVALKGLNGDEIERIMTWCAASGNDLTLIETMPLGEVEEDRTDRYLPLSIVRTRLEQRYTLDPLLHRSGGPARYVMVRELGLRLGFITPMTANFCDSCNRIRVTAKGRLVTCLGHEDGADLRSVLRSDGSASDLDDTISEAIAHKPRRHDFRIEQRGAPPSVARHMSVTGG